MKDIKNEITNLEYSFVGHHRWVFEYKGKQLSIEISQNAPKYSDEEIMEIIKKKL